jgi:hypothetical protein
MGWNFRVCSISGHVVEYVTVARLIKTMHLRITVLGPTILRYGTLPTPKLYTSDQLDPTCDVGIIVDLGRSLIGAWNALNRIELID